MIGEIVKDLYCGADAGTSGGLVLIGEDAVMACSFATSTEVEIVNFLRFYAPRIIFATIERVWGMQGDTPKTACGLCGSYKFLRGLFHAFEIPFDDVPPARWMSKLGCMTGGDKRVSRGFIEQRYPGIKLTNATADAACIAHYTRLMHSRNGVSHRDEPEASSIPTIHRDGKANSPAALQILAWDQENGEK